MADLGRANEEIHNLDVELFLTLVQERPVLWDKTLECYKSKMETTAAWREICVSLNPDFKELSEADKNKYGKILIKRWTNLRDRYAKYLKKVREQSVTGSRGKTVKKYIYSDKMSFLRKNASSNFTAFSLDEGEAEDDVDIKPLYDTAVAYSLPTIDNTTPKQNEFQRPPPNKKRQPKYTEFDQTTLTNLQVPEDRHMSFFKGILPSLQLLKDEEVVSFQIGVLNVLQDIHKARVVANPQPEFDFQIKHELPPSTGLQKPS